MVDVFWVARDFCLALGRVYLAIRSFSGCQAHLADVHILAQQKGAMRRNHRRLHTCVPAHKVFSMFGMKYLGKHSRQNIGAVAILLELLESKDLDIEPALLHESR